MKKCIVIMLAVFLTLSMLAACTDNGTPATTGGDVAVTTGEAVTTAVVTTTDEGSLVIVTDNQNNGYGEVQTPSK